MQIIKKISLAGDGMVGKTSLIRRYVYDQFSDKYLVTIGTKVTRKDMSLKINNQDYDLTLMIWDIMGLTGYHSQLHKKNFNGTTGTIIVCDLTRLDTLMTLNTWKKQIEEIAGRIPAIFLVNKCDLKEQAEFTENDICEEAKKAGVPYLFTSAKTGENVEKAFVMLSEMILKDTESLTK